MSNQPYIGLRPFERNETDIFFGREQHTDQLIDRLGTNHFLAVIGTSGCGKSSLVKTGLIAGLEAGYLASTGTHWCIVEMRPSNQPFQALADKLFSELNDVLAPHYSVETLEQTLRQGSLSLHELLGKYPLPNNAQLLIVCDQFEEIFRYFKKEETSAEARNFVSLLLASSQPYPLSTTQLSHSMYVVITMRSDFLGDCAQFSGLAEAINQGLYLTPRLDAQQLRAAIEEPAFVFGREIEPALVMQLLEDAQNNQDQLPLLQHLLMRLWDNESLTEDDYKDIGGLANALSRHADEVYNGLTDTQQSIAEIMFRNLTERGDAQRDTRRPIPLAKIIELTGATFDEVVAVIDAFRQADCCFLMPPINVALNNDSMIDISHESLIRQWQRLKDWTANEAECAKIYRRLEDRAIEWSNGKAGLLQSPELEIYQQWQAQKKPTALSLWAARYGEHFELVMQILLASEDAKQQELLEKEQARQEREKLQKKVNIILSILLLVAIIIVIGLVGSSGYYYYGYLRPNVTYCNATAKRFGVWQCIGEISENEIKNNAVSYKVIRKGIFNPVQEVMAIDSDGKCNELHPLEAYLPTEKSSKKIEDNDSKKTDKAEDKEEIVSKECLWKYIFDKDLNIVYEQAYDKNAALVWGLVYSSNDKEKLTATAFFVSKNGFPQQTKNSKAEIVRVKYSPLGNDEEISYFDREVNKQIKDEGSGYHQIKANYDKQGNRTAQAYFDLDNQPVLFKDSYGNSYSYHRWTKKYDDKGNQTEEAYFGLDNQPILFKDSTGNQYYKWTRKYDEKGNQIEEAHFGLDNQPILFKDSTGNQYYKWTRKYDEKGKQIEQAYFGLDNQPVLFKDSASNQYHKWTAKYDEKIKKIEVDYYGYTYHQWTKEYDKKGNQTEVAYFGLDEKPVLFKDSSGNQYHKWTKKYDEKGNQLEQAYFGVENQPVLFKDSSGNQYHKWTKKYDEKGNQLEQAYFGVENQPVLFKDSAGNQYHKWTSKYDEKGKQIELAYFGVENQPVLFKDSAGNQYHKWTSKYDEKGKQIELAYFGLDNQPILVKDSYGSQYHKWTRKYDEKGNQLEDACFGLDEKPVLFKDVAGNSYHKWTRKYDEKGNQLEEAYFGLDEKPVLFKDAAGNSYHKWTRKYDEKGNQLEEAYFGLDEKLVLFKDSAGDSYYKWTRKYDDKGNQTEAAYFGLENQPVLFNYGYHKWTRKYDDKGNEIEEAYFGVDNQPVLFKESADNSYHKWTSKYDEKGNQIEEANFGINNEPVLFKDSAGNSYHKWTRKYDDKGKPIEQAYFGVNNEPILFKESADNSYHKWTRKYDDKGNQLELAYFGVNNEPILFKESADNSYHKWTRKYDEKGNQLEQAYFGVNNEPILFKESADNLYHKWTREYDDKGRQTEETYFDTKNKPVLPKDRYTLDRLARMYYDQKNYCKTEEIYTKALTEFPKDTDFLSNDLEVALIQNDMGRFQQRLQVLSPLLKPQEELYVVIPFLNYLANPQQGYQAIIEAIDTVENSKQAINVTWDFSTIEPAINNRQDQKTQQIARLFIHYFKQRIDLKTLKARLAELEKKE